jgi:hypothetical protein
MSLHFPISHFIFAMTEELVLSSRVNTLGDTKKVWQMIPSLACRQDEKVT